MMKRFSFNNMTFFADFHAGCIEKLCVNGKNRLAGKAPLFRIGLRDSQGGQLLLTSFDSYTCEVFPSGALYSDFNVENGLKNMCVRVTVTGVSGRAEWRISVENVDGGYFAEFVDPCPVVLPFLRDNDPSGKGGSVLFPYNEGVLVSDYSIRERSYFCHWPLVYPSYGSLAMFPNMVSSQMLAYIWDDAGLYIGAHDRSRGLKGIDYFADANGIEMRIRIFTGAGFGEDFKPDFPVVFSACGGTWQSAASIYRDWFESELPAKARKIAENCDLPGWYEDSPLVVSYPVRGIHDMDKMEPNAFFPYANALPVLKDIASKTSARLLVLLMHWEGTAPWAPPYVWPPFGGEAMFKDFLEKLHSDNMLLGVYCSGFGYTIKSNLVETCDNSEEFASENLERVMCAGPDGKVLLSNICPGQRSGYDICPASEKGREILAKAYSPLFESGVDYAQILDQNHGGGQYLCYAKDHGHPPAPGSWMTRNMQSLLTSWNEKAGKMILGCESAAAEPFIGNLLLSDNRYEINYHIGRPVPLYSFLYHKYVRNFMGNQVCCPLEETTLTYCYRLSYSFTCGDCMTVVLSPDGNIMSSWGIRDFSHSPGKDTVFKLIAELTRFYRDKAKKYLYDGKMIGLPSPVGTGSYSFNIRENGTVKLPKVICTAWESADKEKAIIAVNPSEEAQYITYKGKQIKIKPLSAKLIKI